MPMGAATVKWDDEGVAPPEATLVKDGILNDYQTTRESASWLTEYYQKKGVPVQSNGCAFAYGGMMSPKLQCPNLVMQPGKSETSFADLVAGTKRGMAIRGALVNSDQQALNVNGYGQYVNEIVDGKLGIALSNVMFNYRGPEFWKNLVAVGGPSSARQFGFAETTGARGSGYRFGHSISAVPGKVVAVAITDSTRK